MQVQVQRLREELDDMKILNDRLLKEVRAADPHFDIADVLAGRGVPRSSRRPAQAGEDAVAVGGPEAAHAGPPASRNSKQDAALDEPSGPVLWTPISPAPRPSPRTRIVCVPGHISQEEHDARMQDLHREYEALQREYEALQARMDELRTEKEAALSRLGAMTAERDELQRSRVAEIAGKDRQIKELTEEISRLKDR